MLKQTVKIVSYLIASFVVGIIVTLVADSIENIAVEKKIRKTIEADIKNAIVSFKDTAPQSTGDDLKLFVEQYTNTVMKGKVITTVHADQRLPDSDDLSFLFTLNQDQRSFDFYIETAFLKSELAILDITDYVSGVVATIIVFTFIILYTENRKQTLALRQHLEIKQQEFSKALEQHEALAFLGRMSAALAHELRTPVSTISNLIQTLPSRSTDAQFIKRFITLVGNELSRTQQLIDNLLVYGKEFDVQHAEWILFEPFLRDVAASDSISLAMEAPQKFMLYGDKFYLNLLFKNLFRNSREAGADEVRIRVAQDQSGNSASVDITCEDNGSGYFTADDMEKLMDPFVTSRSRGGGLGLYLAKKIVTAHGGNLSLYRLKKGAGVRITLPKNRVKIS